MIPDYCVAGLANTGAFAAILAPLALAMVALGAFVLWGRKSKGVALLAIFAVLSLPMTMAGPSAFASTAADQNPCPAGYHYVKSNDDLKSLTVNPESVKRGEEVTFTASKFYEGKTVKFTVHSDPVEAGTAVVKDGKAVLSWKVPADFPLGKHTVKAAVGERVLSATFYVVDENGSGASGVNTSGEAGSNPANDARVPADEAKMAPKTSFTLKADGSSGKDTKGEDLPNWDIAMKAIKAYYGDPKDLGYDGSYKPKGDKPPYVKEMEATAAKWSKQLDALCKAGVAAGKKPAAVFDTDDTTLWSYRFESDIEFAFSPFKADSWYNGTGPYAFNGGKPNFMPATPGMVNLIKSAHGAGCTIIGLTGRNNGQVDYSLDNLKAAGYVDSKGEPIFTKDLYFTNSHKHMQGGYGNQAKYNLGNGEAEGIKGSGYCTTNPEKCGTVEFKAGTRHHIIKDLGFDIVGNFGDQWSDLQGGQVAEPAAGATPNWHKLPNPMYYLPDATYNYNKTAYQGEHPLAGWQAKDEAAGMAPYVLNYTNILPDGSEGKTVKNGDELVNMDILKATIREYYNAKGDKAAGVPKGIANKQDSPYITEMNALTAQKADEVAALCKKFSAKGMKPAAVFDSDDTTLSTYDEEDYAMNWHFKPQKQDDYFFARTNAAVNGADKVDYANLTQYAAPYNTSVPVTVDGQKYNYLVATPGMVKLVQKVHDAGCTIIGLTGRSNPQKDYTVANLAYMGYKDSAGKPLFTKDLFFTKFTGKNGDNMPAYLTGVCTTKAPKCTTQEYKTGTRAHIEKDLGYRIVGNFGDQWSDLQSPNRDGNVYADISVKLPNITYYLP